MPQILPLNVTDSTSPKPNLEHLLRMGVSAARAGNRVAARALFLALTREYPGDVRVWLGLASVATSSGEQREALEQVVAITPDHPQALRALANLAPSPAIGSITQALPKMIAADVAPALAAGVAPAPLHEEGDHAALHTARGNFPLLNAIALTVIGALLLALAFIGVKSLTRPDGTARSSTPTASPVLQLSAASPLPGDAAPGNSPPPAATVETPSEVPMHTPSAIARVTATARATATAGASAVAGSPTAGASAVAGSPTARASAVVTPTAPPGLPLGTLVEVDGWSATLLRPDYALILDGSIGDLRPSGRFVLTLMAVSNNSAGARRIPADLFTIVDSQGHRYSPTPNASSAYLALYGRGQHGDLALEDDLAPSSGMRSVPILFDIPVNVTGLVLTVRDNGALGWPIEGSTSQATNVGP